MRLARITIGTLAALLLASAPVGHAKETPQAPQVWNERERAKEVKAWIKEYVSADEARRTEINRSQDHLERFARSFEISARRWELVVYPSLFAFIVLAAYGFFLIYSLTQDVAVMARSISTMTVAIDSMSDNMNTVSNRMQAVSLNMDDIARKMDVLEPMQTSMDSIDRSTQVMSVTTDAMRYNMTDLKVQMAGMNHSMSPLRTMGGFMPFR